MKKNLNKFLAGNDYPGRGIVLGQSPDGEKAYVAYWIMGRSSNSRNRVFEPIPGGIRTVAADPAKLEDPHLIIYNAVLTLHDTTVVTNGDQTDTVYDFMKEGKTFEEALCTRTFEPDAPNYTPRISGVVERTDGAFTYKLSILKSGDGDPDAPERFFFAYTPKAGKGHFLHTYRCDGNPIPSFDGEPTPVKIEGDLDAFTRLVWESLNEDNKVSLFTRFINLETGEWESRIVNKNQ